MRKGGQHRSAARPSGRVLGRVSAALLLLACVLHAAAPRDYRDHVGVYVWGKLAGGLDAAAADVKRLGADRVVRLYIGPAALWDPAAANDNSPLDVKVRRPDYRAFLAAFPVVMLTAYDRASYDRYKKGPLDSAHLAATQDEFRRFTLELTKTPGRKIVSNWEFENDCAAPQWPACRQYYQARLDGIAQGRKQAKALGYPGEVFTAFEFTVVPGFKGKPSGLVDVAARLHGVDFLSYSSWWSIAWDADASKVYKDFAYLAGFLRNAAAERKLTTRLIVGEFGEYWNNHPNAERMKSLIDASLDNGVEYLFSWVLYDQPGNKDEWGRDASHFGKYRLDRMLTSQGLAFQRWFTGAPPKP
ncbi:MAG: hypothetical protein LAP40_01700 [Acidobacteriia bacterium]|nr:hypothetical protein [Terriglobia bacterium]